MSETLAFFRGCMIPTKQPHVEYVARLVLPCLGVQLVDVDGFTCCPDPVGVGAADPFTWVTIAARNISLAEERNLDMLTLCNGCAYTLRHAVHDHPGRDQSHLAGYQPSQALSPLAGARPRPRSHSPRRPAPAHWADGGHSYRLSFAQPSISARV